MSDHESGCSTPDEKDLFGGAADVGAVPGRAWKGTDRWGEYVHVHEHVNEHHHVPDP
ncbi:MAG: hypothetical protein ACR2L2_05445 [Acidobacteriota bacterium]